ncbi:DUF3169 family protein [Macrococcus equi]|uniref:DUF3169 family protein n=1 Tax=Macrococcus equi TaxID=3395462 RepID=UPI0039BDE9EA
MRSNKKILKSIIYLVIGAFVGFIIGIGIPLSQDIINYFNKEFNIDFIPYIIGLLFLIAIYLYYLSVKQCNNMKNTQNLSEDDQYIYQLKHYNKASMNIVNATNLSVLAIALNIANFLFEPTKHNIILCIVFSIVFFIFVVISRKQNIKVISLFPQMTNSDFEIDYEDRNILNTIINHIDEGERLVMLHALSKTYSVMIYMLSGLLVFLAFYQAGTGENQVLAMIGITAVLVYSTIAYYKKSEEFNK